MFCHRMEHSEAFSLGYSGRKCGGKTFGSMCEQIDYFLGEGETEAAHICLNLLPATQKAGEPWGPEMEMKDLSSLEH